MSYDVYLEGVESVPLFNEGGVLCVGGSTNPYMSVTYNYSFFYYHFLDKVDGLRWLNGKTGAETLDRLTQAVSILGTDQWRAQTTNPFVEGPVEYWTPTPGNAGYALNILRTWAQSHPKGIWRVT